MIHPGFTRSARVGFLAGVHRGDDRFRLALYRGDADLGPDTRTYDGTDEVQGEGYRPGGRDVPGWRVDDTPDGARIRFDPVVWPDSTIAARGGLIYNDSRPGLPAVAVLDFGRDVHSTDGPFRVRCPEGGLLLWGSEVMA